MNTNANFTQLARFRNLTAFRPDQTEISLSQAAAQLSEGQPVIVQQTHTATYGVCPTPRSFPGTDVEDAGCAARVTQTVRTRLANEAELDSFVRVETRQSPANALEALAARLKPLESHVGTNGWIQALGTEELGQTAPSAFEAAKRLGSGQPVAVIR
jgi:hypothetical protein